ncbi:MAG TPA: hypothetical protein VG271_01965 [Beijerinckiaceae bacterium]|nr:hypothetical protein [Beijerinckiaceae bacterium]
MTLTPPRALEDPSLDAAQLLVRLGIALLAIAVPCGAVVSRRLIFSLMPVGGVLILIGMALAPSRRGLEQFRAALLSPTGLTALFLIGWSGLSLAWTPFAPTASESFLKTAATALLAACVAASLPDRTKTSNLYLLPIGAAAAALATFLVALVGPPGLRGPDLEGSAIARSAVTLIVSVWPALGALAVRERWVSAAALAIAVAIAAIAVWTPVALGSFALSAIVFSFATTNPIRVSRLLAGLFAALFLVAPALPLALSFLIPERIAASGSLPAAILVWADIVKGEGLRLITGHGLDTMTRGVIAGFLPAATPTSVLFQIWYELGIVGACTSAALVARAFLAAGRTSSAIAPFLLAGLVCVLTIAISGLSTAQLWWVTQLAVVAIAFAVVAKGQYRTVRPAVRVISGELPPSS